MKHCPRPFHMNKNLRNTHCPPCWNVGNLIDFEVAVTPWSKHQDNEPPLPAKLLSFDALWSHSHSQPCRPDFLVPCVDANCRPKIICVKYNLSLSTVQIPVLVRKALQGWVSDFPEGRAVCGATDRHLKHPRRVTLRNLAAVFIVTAGAAAFADDVVPIDLELDVTEVAFGFGRL
ncbi:hypothetical protein BC830DRAFT_70567 [Chytriomyces sp. MP71]|nr:hypothetical protein BC830DRAFT_70567 [Chytriomyces sp. MP71]